jgi:hypothetical protein
MTLLAKPMTMATTQLAREIRYEGSIPWQSTDDTKRQPLRMNWVVVTGEDGRRQLRMQWLALD